MPTYNDFNSAGLAFFQQGLSGGIAAASTSAAISSVSVSTTPSVLQAANTSRKGLIAYNQGPSAVLIAYTTGVSSTNYSLSVGTGQYWEMPVPLYNQGMSVAVSTANTGGTATFLVTELS